MEWFIGEKPEGCANYVAVAGFVFKEDAIWFLAEYSNRPDRHSFEYCLMDKSGTVKEVWRDGIVHTRGAG